jgi:hypothetical protein
MEYDPTKPKSRKPDQVAKAIETREADEDFRWLMAHKQGRRLMWQWLSDAGVFRSSFSTNALHMAHLEGQRNAGLQHIERIHRLCPERYTEMQKEQKDSGRSE